MIAFTIPGAPHGKGRPRATRFGKGIRLYTDAKTASYEGLVAYAAHVAMEGRPAMTAAVGVSVRVRLTPPASASRAARAAMLSGAVLPAKRPDLDNIAKSIMDGCNGVVFVDDAQVVSITASKRYADTAGVDVWISIAETTPQAAAA